MPVSAISMSLLTAPWFSFFRRLIRQRWFGITLKVVVAVLLLGGLYLELRSRNNLPALWAEFSQQFGGAGWWWLPFAVVLMPLNWVVETLKWQPYMRHYQPLSIWQALRGVFAGISFTMFTPHQLGEYGGRLLYVQPEHRWKAIMINVVGSWAQYLVAVLAGVIGALIFLGQQLTLPPTMLRYGALIAGVALPLLLFGYFHIRRILPLARRIPLLHRLRPFVRDVYILQTFRQRDLWQIFGLAALRYVIFATQYFFLLRFFGIPANLLAGYAGISTIFLVQTIVPLPAIMGLLLRGNIALFVWSQFGANEVSALAATFTLWIINLILPALIGTFSLFYVNIPKTLGYENE